MPSPIVVVVQILPEGSKQKRKKSAEAFAIGTVEIEGETFRVAIPLSFQGRVQRASLGPIMTYEPGSATLTEGLHLRAEVHDAELKFRKFGLTHQVAVWVPEEDWQKVQNSALS